MLEAGYRFAKQPFGEAVPGMLTLLSLIESNHWESGWELLRICDSCGADYTEHGLDLRYWQGLKVEGQQRIQLSLVGGG